jgi:predicted SAM-dependent methyltransferase
MSLLDSIGLTRKITRPRLRAFLERHRSEGKTLDVGCGSALYGDLFPHRITLDIEQRKNVAVDVIGDAHNLSLFPQESFDVVLCTEVLEHLHTPAQAIAEFHRVLKPGGTLLLTTRFVFPLHDTPNDYYRYTKYGLEYLLRDFEDVEITEETSTIETIAVLFQRIGFQCHTLGLRPLKLFWFCLAKCTLAFRWILTQEYGDIGHKQKERHILASGYHVVARKQKQQT